MDDVEETRDMLEEMQDMMEEDCGYLVSQPIGVNSTIPLNLEKVVLSVKNPLITFEVVKARNPKTDEMNRYDILFFIGDTIKDSLNGVWKYNDGPYATQERAVQEFRHIEERMRQGSYRIEFTPPKKLKLVIT